MKNKNKIPPVRALSMGYAITILAGTILLLLPISTRSGETTKFIDALFTATSATCVTGLIPFDTFTHWTLFGQIVILILIQIGGLGFMTILTIIFMIFKRNISLYNRTILMQSAGTYNISEVTKLIKRIIVGTLLIEAVGATILSLEFAKTFSTPRAIYYGIFHSVSAFCNAGFDVLGSSTGSLTQYFNNEVILITIMVLIVIGILLIIKGDYGKTYKEIIPGFIVFLILVGIATTMNVVFYHTIVKYTSKTFSMFYISPYFTSSLAVFSDIHKALGWIPLMISYVAACFLAVSLIYVVIKYIKKWCLSRTLKSV